LIRDLVILALVLGFTGTLHAQRVNNYGKAPAAPAQPLNTDAVGLDEKLGDQVPLDLEFRDERDQPILLSSAVAGKPTILVLAYFRCPQLCTQVINSLTDQLKKLPTDVGDQFNVVIVSIDPKDLPGIASAKKWSYLKEYGRPNVENGWHFLTGKQEQIDELCKAVGFRYEINKTKKPWEYNHASGLMILTPHGKLSKYIFGLEYDELSKSLEEAGAGKIGKKSEPNAFMKMLCYDRNPDTGEYTPSVMKVLRLIFGTLVLVLAVWLIRVWRRPPLAASLSTSPGTDTDMATPQAANRRG